MSRLDRLLDENQQPNPVDVACLLATDRFWNHPRLRLIGTHPDWPDAPYYLKIDQALGHALVLVLSQLPVEGRRGFAELFYEERRGPSSHLETLASSRIAAAVVLETLDIVDGEQVVPERVLDLLHGMAQGDDPTVAPPAAVAALRKTIGRIRFDVELEDPINPVGVVALAIAEVLDPSSEFADMKEVLARCAFGAVRTWDSARVLAFLLAVDSLFAEALATDWH